MALTLPYRVSKRRCWFVSPSRMDARGNVGGRWNPYAKEYEQLKCKSSPIIWPKLSLTDQNTPICEAHARHFYGNERVDNLIRIGAIKVWKVSQENGSVQTELPVVKGETTNDTWQELS